MAVIVRVREAFPRQQRHYHLKAKRSLFRQVTCNRALGAMTPGLITLTTVSISAVRRPSLVFLLHLIVLCNKYIYIYMNLAFRVSCKEFPGSPIGALLDGLSKTVGTASLVQQAYTCMYVHMWHLHHPNPACHLTPQFAVTVAEVTGDVERKHAVSTGAQCRNQVT
jgi:hypothetical protein